MSDKQSFTGGTNYFDNSAPSVGLAQLSQPLAMTTPDTAFYQWVPFVLLLQVSIGTEEASNLFLLFRQPCSVYQGRSGKHVREGSFNHLVKQNLLISESIKKNPISGKDARTIVMLKGDSENQAKKGQCSEGRCCQEVLVIFSKYFAP